MEKPRQSTSALCRTLAHALKRLFKSVKIQNGDNSPNAPVDIIRKDLSRPASYLPRISQVSSFLDFEFPDVEYDGIDNHTRTLPMTSEDSNTIQGPQRTLLPANSLSHFNLHQPYTDHSRRLENIRPIEQVIHAGTGKVASYKPVLVSKKSTLQIHRPNSLHVSISSASLAASVLADNSSSVIRRTKGSGNLRKCARADPLAAETPSLTPTAEENCSLDSRTSQQDPLRLVKHFASFCIIDIAAPGCPVSAVSEDLRYLYDIRDRFVLNAHECSELSMDLSVGRDPDGNEVTYLLLFSPLVSPATTRSRFMLVSAIDVSGYVRYAASLESNPEPRQECMPPNSLRQISEPERKLSSVSWLDERIDQLADELLHGCSIKKTPAGNAASKYRALPTSDVRKANLDSEDIWTAIAREEGLMARQVSAASRSTGYVRSASNPLSFREQRQATASTNSQSSLNYADEEVLGRFVESLQVLYSQYFLLACSPLNGDFYEICYVSPAVYASGEYVSGHLSRTSFNLLRGFGAHLAAGRRFRATIRWGHEGVEKQLYCVPLMGHQPAPWICVLVDKETPIDW